MVFVIVFNEALSAPLSYHWGRDMYEACTDCIRAHELRTCDGETLVTFEVCGKHDEAAKDPYFDHDMLGELRRVGHPLYSPIPTFPLTAAGITATSKHDLAKKVKETDAVYVPVRYNRRGMTRRIEEPVPLRPRPIVKYAHVAGCIHSEVPNTVLLSKEDVEVMDRFATQRLDNISALLAAGIDYELGPDRGLGSPAITAAFSRSDSKITSDIIISGTSPARLASGSDKRSPPSSPAQSEFSSDLSPEEAARLIFNATESEAQSLLRAEKKRLKECLAVSTLVKGTYFKRCNGAWINGLGDALPVDSPGDLVIEKVTIKEMEDVQQGDNRTAEQAQTDLQDDLGQESPIGIGTSASTSSSSTKSTSPQSRVSTAATSTNVLFAETPSSTTSERATNKDATIRGQNTRIFTLDKCNPYYGYALPNTNETLTMSDPSADLTVRAPTDLKDPTITANAPASVTMTKTPPAPFKYPTSMLQAREQLVHIGQSTIEDLALTSWAWNRTAKRQASKVSAVKELADGEQNKPGQW